MSAQDWIVSKLDGNDPGKAVERVGANDELGKHGQDNRPIQGYIENGTSPNIGS
ncbi:15460_t:CDS:2 [Acaulospora colombiana]|uniref:15460_t:CDS:1 n=1 Tax=Acaulospora colombiana TaxID=27376 RepID=A0ACA9MT50_9GLOM|nr:15460_t:CDS:2 [Acaulospora colombiana]